ncbi:MAG: ATP-binding protein [Akkermansia sp.]
MDWKDQVVKWLKDSLHPIPSELNEIDWKSDLSPKSERIAEHISAFANQEGGGCLVFGINDDASFSPLSKPRTDKIIQTLGNIAANNLSVEIKIEHDIILFEDHPILFIFIPEQEDKPVYLRGKDIFNCYWRSAGQTIKMSRQKVKSLLATSPEDPFETQLTRTKLNPQEVKELLNYKKFFQLIEKTLPESDEAILSKLQEFKLCVSTSSGWAITNLGAILFANNLASFPSLGNRSVIVYKYKGLNNRQLSLSKVGQLGYASGFENLINFIINLTCTEEINDTFRKNIPTYPRVAIRELVANALVHQDFSVSGRQLTVEIFTDRISITNPGSPLNDINRFIDLPPKSRNEILAQTLLLFHICERRGSGMDRAVEAIEEMYLPAIKISKGDQFTKVTLFAQKDFSEMTNKEKIDACYQHACLVFEDNKRINNQSLRERFKLDKNKSSIASRIIADTLEAGYIKLADENASSKKFASYIPFYG